MEERQDKLNNQSNYYICKLIIKFRMIEIKAGFNGSTELVFERCGNEASGLNNSDLIFKIKESPHS